MKPRAREKSAARDRIEQEPMLLRFRSELKINNRHAHEAVLSAPATHGCLALGRDQAMRWLQPKAGQEKHRLGPRADMGLNLETVVEHAYNPIPGRPWLGMNRERSLIVGSRVIFPAGLHLGANVIC